MTELTWLLARFRAQTLLKRLAANTKTIMKDDLFTFHTCTCFNTALEGASVSGGMERDPPQYKGEEEEEEGTATEASMKIERRSTEATATNNFMIN